MKQDKYGRQIVKKTISGKDYIVTSEQKKYTRYKKNPMTGRFTGRFNVDKRFSDNLRYIRIIHPIDINKDKIPDLNMGQVIGRLKKGMITKPASLKVNVHLSNPLSREAMKSIQREKFRKIRQQIKGG